MFLKVAFDSKLSLTKVPSPSIWFMDLRVEFSIVKAVLIASRKFELVSRFSPVREAIEIVESRAEIKTPRT